MVSLVIAACIAWLAPPDELGHFRPCPPVPFWPGRLILPGGPWAGLWAKHFGTGCRWGVCDG